jgi:hypothetical protein
MVLKRWPTLQCWQRKTLARMCCEYTMALPPEKQEVVNSKIANALANRVDRILLVLECCADNKNYLACLRTCDILGVQNVWIIEAPLPVRGGSKQQQQQQDQQQQDPQQPKLQGLHSTSAVFNGSLSQSSQQKGPDKRLTVEQVSCYSNMPAVLLHSAALLTFALLHGIP